MYNTRQDAFYTKRLTGMRNILHRKRTLGKYILLQLPGLIIITVVLTILKNNFGLTTNITIIILAAWILKDIVLFPFVWRSYDSGSTRDPIVGREGAVLQGLNPEGTVKIGMETWTAEAEDSCEIIPPGAEVTVTGKNGHILTVKRKEGNEI